MNQVALREQFTTDVRKTLEGLILLPPSPEALSTMMVTAILDLLQRERAEGQIPEESEAKIKIGRRVDDVFSEELKMDLFFVEVVSKLPADVYLIFSVGARTLFDLHIRYDRTNFEVLAFRRERT